MILLHEYFGKWADHADVTDEVENTAIALLDKVNGLLSHAYHDGIAEQLNPATQSCISGKEYGGFRPQCCRQGAPKSSHKTGAGVDIYDPDNELDAWINTFDTEDGARNTILEHYGLYREASADTQGWCHLTTRAPGSGRRTFKP